MAKISCIIVDDEPLALELLEKYVRNTPFLELVGQCSNALEAMAVLDEQQVDLIFLDIQMPELTGLEFSRVLTKHTKIIFTTAFDEYAIEGYKVNAVDYLLKPFNYEEFIAAATKAKELIEYTRPVIKSENEEYIFVRVEYKQIRIALNTVLYFEGLKDYVKIWMVGNAKPILTLISLKALEKDMPEGKFMRIHRSFIVALDKIQSIERYQVIINDNVRITVAEQYKGIFQDFINHKSIGSS